MSEQKTLRAFVRRHIAVGDWTLYTNVSIPFTRFAIILDIGRHACLGYSLRGGRSQRWPDWSRL